VGDGGAVLPLPGKLNVLWIHPRHKIWLSTTAQVTKLTDLSVALQVVVVFVFQLFGQLAANLIEFAKSIATKPEIIFQLLVSSSGLWLPCCDTYYSANGSLMIFEALWNMCFFLGLIESCLRRLLMPLSNLFSSRLMCLSRCALDFWHHTHAYALFFLAFI
jgi:hypothetical protein